MNKKIKEHTMVILILIIIITFIVAFVFSMNTLTEKESEPMYTLEEAIDLQLNNGTEDLKFDGQYLVSANDEDVKTAMNPKKQNRYQFVTLNKPSKVTIEQAEQLLDDSGVLKGTGEYFVKAEQKYKVNALYLMAHAKVETGNGESELAKGIKVDEVHYYNFFGIGAFDEAAVKEGSSFAKKSDWNTKERAILGGAKFVRENYLDNNQNTLYEMRWNPENPGTHLYATDIGWAESIADILEKHYSIVNLQPDNIKENIYKSKE